MTNKTKIIILVSILVIVLALVLCYIFIINSNSPIEFTSEKWNEHIYQRERMIDSLNSNYNLISMNYEQIVELLGTNGIDERSGKNEIIYYTGKAEYFRKVKINQSFFSITFDNDGNCLGISINTIH